MTKFPPKYKEKNLFRYTRRKKERECKQSLGNIFPLAEFISTEISENREILIWNSICHLFKQSFRLKNLHKLTDIPLYICMLV